MIFHLGYEIPVQLPKVLAADEELFTPEEIRIVKSQIRKNRITIDSYIKRIDLFVNQERYPRQEAFIEKIRERLSILMEENDTFRKVLWRHTQNEHKRAFV
ncbi:MAG: hypothetical protein BWY44_00889 [Candidatus Omnitrophica bacterium ADurb.Bin292]|jgi:hypothetical protein|nr:MAG: hypothetical protein BWY44_00889 [Candidatus Omnitrophica bacterium ADurb.Bin292]HPW77401.1 hypothetical protein [Candidatus Omnitrophota bacterium]HQB12260.1 hypothetical protein [Candidatus Omnitrophota bacterium]